MDFEFFGRPPQKLTDPIRSIRQRGGRPKHSKPALTRSRSVRDLLKSTSKSPLLLKSTSRARCFSALGKPLQLTRDHGQLTALGCVFLFPKITFELHQTHLN